MTYVHGWRKLTKKEYLDFFVVLFYHHKIFNIIIHQLTICKVKEMQIGKIWERVAFQEGNGIFLPEMDYIIIVSSHFL